MTAGTRSKDGRGQKGQSVADRLSAAIRAGRYAPGQRLVESELTGELAVSRGPVREAFRRLSAEGLVELVPNRGALVRRLSAREAEELFDIRAELEAMAARRAANRMSDACVRAVFEQSIAPMRDDAPTRNAQGYIAENQAFHAAIFEAAGNARLARLNEQLQLSLLLAQISSALTGEIIAASVSEHRRIAGAILAGDAAAADGAMREHLERAMELMGSMPPELFRRAR